MARLVRNGPAWKKGPIHRMNDDGTIACNTRFTGEFIAAEGAPMYASIRLLCGNCFKVRNFKVLVTPNSREVTTI